MLVDAVGTVWHIVRISSQITRSQPLFKAVVRAPFYRQGICGQVSGLAIGAEAEQPQRPCCVHHFSQDSRQLSQVFRACSSGGQRDSGDLKLLQPHVRLLEQEN